MPPDGLVLVQRLGARAPAPLPAPQRPAMEVLREVQLHFHGVTPEDVAAILARQNRRDRR